GHARQSLCSGPRTQDSSMRITAVSFVLFTSLAACSDAPRPVAASSQASQPSTLPPDHPTLPDDHPKLPSNHPSIDEPALDPAIEFSGRARLVGALRDVKIGFVFFSVRTPGARAPLLSYRIDLNDPNLREPVLVTEPDGVREINFVLNQRTTMM